MCLNAGRISSNWESDDSTDNRAEVGGESGNRSVKAISELSTNAGEAILKNASTVEAAVAC